MAPDPRRSIRERVENVMDDTQKTGDAPGTVVELGKVFFSPSGLIVLAGWVSLSALTYFYVVYSGVNFPFQDDFNWVRVFSGVESPGFSWFWQRHASHAFPLTRVLITLICRLSNFDFRLVFLLNATLFSLGSLILTLSAARSRGRASVFDLLFSLHGASLLNFWSLLEGINLSFALYFFCSQSCWAAFSANSGNHSG